MASPGTPVRLSGLARRLVQDGLLDEAQAAAAQTEARRANLSLVDYLVRERKLDARRIAAAASDEFGLPLLDLAALDREQIPKDLADEKLVRQHNVLPILRRGTRLYVAVADPTNLHGLDEFKFSTGLATEPILVEADKLHRLIEEVLTAADTSMAEFEGLDEDLEKLDVAAADEEGGGPADVQGADDTPVVRFVNKVLLDAINKGASDIHFEPYEHFFRVRFRIDGILQEIAKPPVAMAPRITARIKVMSRLDVSERRVPQDGRIKLRVSKNRAIDFRVNTCPTLFGEKVVLRILDPSSAKLGIDALGYEPEQKEAYLKALRSPYGMILVTGPTGSGKTVSLYTGLNILNTPGINISTAEDPAEINLPGINQVNVNPKVGLDFAAALRAFLRQDPDVIMVGEIRDLETANIAIKAAQTGHLVLSTLHTNNAAQTLSRLVNMGVAPFNIASAVILIIAQRLARRLCEHCKQPDDIPKEALIEEGFDPAEVDGLTIYKAVGCDRCVDGYKGRIGIYEVMPMSEEIGRIIMEGGNAMQIADQARKEGVKDLRQSALKKVKDGLISLAEANRVTID
ncbi:MAG: type 4 fimbrial assembly protein PilB [Gammaproteobacteria bacterium]|nr:MAG: type 4 fimbrial assembly protein PilB [Gammaproteobacteria bacterium]